MKGAVVDSGRLHPNGRGVEPSRARRDTRYKQTYIFGGARGTTTGLILLYVNAEAVGLHLDAIAKAVAPGSHALFIADRAGGTKQTACKCQIKLRALHCRRIHHN
jgi:hypothetical protein